jgi:hypothetical protein
MTKRKPDQVIEYRVSLQDKQSEQLDSMIAAYQVNKIATPLVALLSDASAMLLITGLLEASGVIDLDKGLLARIAAGAYETYQDAMDAVDAAAPFLDPREAGTRVGKMAGDKPLVKAWVWLMTTGRILIEEKTE